MVALALVAAGSTARASLVRVVPARVKAAVCPYSGIASAADWMGDVGATFAAAAAPVAAPPTAGAELGGAPSELVSSVTWCRRHPHEEDRRVRNDVKQRPVGAPVWTAWARASSCPPSATGWTDGGDCRAPRGGLVREGRGGSRPSVGGARASIETKAALAVVASVVAANRGQV